MKNNILREFWLLKKCRLKEVAQHAEKGIAKINSGNKEQFKEILMNRLDDLSTSQKSRVKSCSRE